MEKNTREITDPTELLDKNKTSDKLLEFAGEAYRKGILRFDHFKDPDFLKRVYFKFLVTIHELGHEFVALGLGWRVLSFENTPGPGYAGRVIVAPPSGVNLYEYLLGLAIIAAAGQEALGDPMGAGSDDRQVEKGAMLTKVGISEIHSRSRSRIPSQTRLFYEALNRMPKAA